MIIYAKAQVVGETARLAIAAAAYEAKTSPGSEPLNMSARWPDNELIGRQFTGNWFSCITD